MLIKYNLLFALCGCILYLRYIEMRFQKRRHPFAVSNLDRSNAFDIFYLFFLSFHGRVGLHKGPCSLEEGLIEFGSIQVSPCCRRFSLLRVSLFIGHLYFGSF